MSDLLSSNTSHAIWSRCEDNRADIITTRPQGVGAGRSPPLWLKDGDVVKVSLEGVGSCTNTVEHVKNEGSKAKL